ncbi:hypothetical protein MicloDRAFT_00009550 [Microvirga lotononidis]|uniref:Uncharacterized protein n=2 Tax=Microvirga lotononidis TaxID=864069 RepID=I4Z2G2_9HYPH|nr:hypothetical protein MicloDRAFT_00009550 [Microvirga lotononidis]
MTKPTMQVEDETGDTGQASTPHLDRLEKLAHAAATAAQAKQWRAHKNGMQQQDEPSDVRNLSHDAQARARAEEAMRLMMAKPQSKRRSR